jgi:transcription elongation factor S-II
MASESVKAMNQKITENNLFKAKAVGETNAETDAFKCSRCQQRKCTYYQMQTRSADEPMTVCLSLGYELRSADMIDFRNVYQLW